MGSSNIFPQHPVDRPFPRIIQMLNPIAGAEILYPCPANTRLDILGFSFTFTSSAFVANRNIDLFMSDGITDWFGADANFAHAGGFPLQYHFVPGQVVAAYTVGAERYIPIIPRLELFRGLSLYTITANIDALDQFSNIYIYCFAFPDLVNMAPA